MSNEFLTEYHRNYCRPHKIPSTLARCGSPSSKMAQTSEPCFKQKRKESGHDTRRTYTTDYMQFEDVNDLEGSAVPGEQAMRYKSGYRRVQFYPVSQYRLNYDWKSGETPLELAAKQQKQLHHSEKLQTETKQNLPHTNGNSSDQPPAVPSSDDIPRPADPDHSLPPRTRPREAGSPPLHRSSSPHDDVRLASYPFHEPRTSHSHSCRSPSPCSLPTKPVPHHHHNHHDHCHTRDCSSHNPLPISSTGEVTKQDHTNHASNGGLRKTEKSSRMRPHARENSMAFHQPRERHRRERKRTDGDGRRSKRGKENQREHSKQRTRGVDVGPETQSTQEEESNFYRRYQRSTAFPSPPRHRSSSHWTTEYTANYGSPLKASYVNGIWHGAHSPERHLQPSIGQNQPKAEPSSIVPTYLQEKPLVLQYSAPSSWFDQVVELREKAADYKQRTRGNYFSREKLAELEQAQLKLQRRASSSTFTSSSSTTSSIPCSRSSTPEPGGNATTHDNAATPTHHGPVLGRTSAQQPDNPAEVQVEDVELSGDTLVPQCDEQESTVHTLTPGRSVRPAESSSPPPVSRLLRAPPTQPMASHGRLPTPELARQQMTDPNAANRHHLDRTTPTKGSLLASIPPSLHLMGGSRRPPPIGPTVPTLGSQAVVHSPHKSQHPRIKSARRAILRDNHYSQGRTHPPPARNLTDRWPQTAPQHGSTRLPSHPTSSHPPPYAMTTQPMSIATETAPLYPVSQPVSTTKTTSHFLPTRSVPTTELAPQLTNSSVQPMSSSKVAPLYHSTQPVTQTLTSDPVPRSIAARPMSCCARNTCDTCGASLHVPSHVASEHAPRPHSHIPPRPHPHIPRDGKSYQIATVDHVRGGVSSTPATSGTRIAGTNSGQLPIHEQNRALSLSTLSLSSSCSVASGILERARHRRDHFWS